MSLFWTLVILMLAMGIASVLLPLWRSGGKGDEPAEEMTDASLAIYQQRLKELQTDQDLGALEPQQVQAAKLELERELLRENSPSADSPETASPAQMLPRGIMSVLLVLLMPAMALGLYYQLGTPRLVSGPPDDMATTGNNASHQVDMQSLEEMITKLRQRLTEQPDDLKGWMILGRTYMSLERYDEAAQALEHAYSLRSDVPGILLRYADALAMSQGGRLEGKPAEYIDKARELAPNDPGVLWLSGMVAAEQEDFGTALGYWQRVLPMLEDEDQRREVQQMIGQARQRLGENPVGEATAPVAATPPKAASPAIAVQVQVADSLARDIAPDTTVFVYARAMQGPPMPLAIVRKLARDLPLRVTLTDALAMSPAMRLSKFQQVRITARISQNGTAMPQSGDLYGEVTGIPVNSKEAVTVVIDRRVP